MQIGHLTPPRFAKGRLAQRKSAVVASDGVLSRLERWVWKLQQRGVERYLASSQDVFELESRIRDLHRDTRQLY